MINIYADRLSTYGNQTSAKALFFHSATQDLNHVKSSRVLLPNEELEFSDHSYITGKGAFLIDLRRPDYSSILCYFDIVMILPVLSTVTTSVKPRGQ